jgi:hypothetical protein
MTNTNTSPTPKAVERETSGLTDEDLHALAMASCGVLHGDVLHMGRKQCIAFGRKVLSAASVQGLEAQRKPVALVVVRKDAEDEFFWMDDGVLLDLQPGEYELCLASSPSACVAPTAGVPPCDGGQR